MCKIATAVYSSNRQNTLELEIGLCVVRLESDHMTKAIHQEQDLKIHYYKLKHLKLYLKPWG